MVSNVTVILSFSFNLNNFDNAIHIINAILSGNGSNLYGDLEFLPKLNEIEEGAIVYTSGIDGIISPAIPVGKIKITDDVKYVEFFVNYNQLKLIRVNN